MVTGAGGKTGKQVFSQLKNGNYGSSVTPVGLVRSNASSKKLAAALKASGSSNLSSDEVVLGDVTDPKVLTEAMRGMDRVVLCTSAVPKIKKWPLAKLMFKKMVLRRKDAGRPEFRSASLHAACMFNPSFCTTDVIFMRRALAVMCVSKVCARWHARGG